MAYNFHFDPVDLPRMSRFITVEEGSSTDVGELVLSKGKRFTGTITLAGSDPTRPAGFALVRVFRIGVDDGGDPAAVLLDETYTDANGKYSVLLPTR